MSWDVDMVTMVRVLMKDGTVPYKYADEYLKQVIICAGFQVRQDIVLPYDYVFDLSALTITPDPMTSDDAVAIALLPLKAACILSQGEYIAATGRAIRVRDGDSQIDTSAGFKGFRDILELGPCLAYDKLRWRIQASSATAIGAIVGAFRIPGEGWTYSIPAMYDRWSYSITNPRQRTDDLD